MILLTDLANSMTEICMPKQIPKYGTLFSRAYFAANIIPPTPRSPNPPGTSTHEAFCREKSIILLILILCCHLMKNG